MHQPILKLQSRAIGVSHDIDALDNIPRLKILHE